MNILEANRIIRNYYDITNPTEDDTFLYTEALDYVIQKKKDPAAMVDLGSFYYGNKQFDLALKYYEMAAEYGELNAISDLGYIWYYGRTGEKNYEKAFYYFDKAMKAGDKIAAYKIADMYKNGYYVEKDYDKYKEIIEDLYNDIRNRGGYDGIVPEIYTRMARIRTEEGDVKEALRLYDIAREVLAYRIQYNQFWGNLNIMKWMINDIYAMREFNPDHFELYDLYYLLLKPVKVRFLFEEKVHEIEAVEEEGQVVIRFDDHWYRTVDDLFMNAELDGEPLTMRYEELYDFEVIDDGTDQE